MVHSPSEKPLRIINSIAPVRICDNGGWTDTWFAEHGKIFNIGVAPYVEVQIAVYPRSARPDRFVIYAENYGERFSVTPGKPSYPHHALLEATIEEVPPPEEYALEISLFSEVPAGASTGTSASVCVALIGALDALTPGRMTAHEIAYAAHRVETERLGQQSGIQDQFSAAFGALNYIEMPFYPIATVSQIPVSEAIWRELGQRLILIFLGKSHTSSAVHEQVIAGLEKTGSNAAPLAKLRRAAEQSRDAVSDGDFTALGRAMIENTQAQAELHPALVNTHAQELIALAKEYGVIGWKVNGAGGDGGSLTLLCGTSASSRRSLLRTIAEINPLFQAIPISLSRTGLYVWEGSL